MPEFLILFLFRCLSGAQNGFGYAKNTAGRTICTGLMLAGIGGTFTWFFPAESWTDWAAAGWLIIALVGTIGVEDSFNPGFEVLPRDIHLWEGIATGAYLLAWIAADGNLIYILTSIYPALLIHKGLINLGSGLYFWDHRTDDRSGKTYRIPLLGIAIPRFSLRTRISIAVVSLLIVIINATSLRWSYTFSDVLSRLQTIF